MCFQIIRSFNVVRAWTRSIKGSHHLLSEFHTHRVRLAPFTQRIFNYLILSGSRGSFRIVDLVKLRAHSNAWGVLSFDKLGTLLQIVNPWARATRVSHLTAKDLSLLTSNPTIISNMDILPPTWTALRAIKGYM
jgi:hypothetical protein